MATHRTPKKPPTKPKPAKKPSAKPRTTKKPVVEPTTSKKPSTKPRASKKTAARPLALSAVAAAYRALIDEAVEHARAEDLVARIQKDGIYSKAPAHRAHNAFIRSLSKEQRRLLAELLRDERGSALHDLLAAWSWWITVKGLGFTLENEPMPVDYSGQGLHGDFIGRLEGWDWPEEP